MKRNEIMMVVPSLIEKHLLFVSPFIPTAKLTIILNRLALMGATVLDV